MDEHYGPLPCRCGTYHPDFEDTACVAYRAGKRDGIAEGIRIERARVVAFMRKYADENDHERDWDAANRAWAFRDAASMVERGEHVAEGGE